MQLDSFGIFSNSKHFCCCEIELIFKNTCTPLKAWNYVRGELFLEP